MRKRFMLLALLCVFLFSGCQATNTQPPQPMTKEQNQEYKLTRQSMNQTPDLAGGTEYSHRIPQPLSLSDLKNKYPSHFVLSGPSDKREIALTFDDAPDEQFTSQVLDALKKDNVKATFFIVGNRAEKHPDLVRRIAKEGHAIGNHSYNHADFNKLNDPQFQSQIKKTDEILNRLIGYTPKIVRPPYGNVTEEQIKWLASQNKKIVNWNVDSLDWKGLNAEQVQTNVLADIQPGAIVLQHSGGGEGEDLTGTVQAIPTIVKKLRGDGVTFVTVPDLLDLNNQLP